MIRKVISYLVVLTIAATIGIYLFQRGKTLLAASQVGEEVIPTSVAKVRSIRETIEVSGVVEPLLSTEIKSEISGRVAAVRVKDGDDVELNQILVELDPTSLRTDLTEAERDLQAQSLRLERERRDFQRLENLFENRFVQEKELLDAKTNLQISEIDLAIRRARLEKAEENLSKTTIRAPHNGIVSDRGINPGQVIVGATSVNQGTTLMKVNDLAELTIKIDIGEIDIGKISREVIPTITIDAYPDQTFEGRIAEIARFAINRDNIRVFPIEVRFGSGGFEVSPGVSANVEILVSESPEAISIPITGVFTELGETVVYRLENLSTSGGKPDPQSWERVKVTIGLSDFEFVEILSGLQTGDEVATRRPTGFQ
ncbi:MAG: efflux RND transporter periplasmic adaptor subunit [Puniceicoccaceae bacterium]